MLVTQLSDSSSSNTNTPGKTPLALPSRGSQPIFEHEYEVEELADKGMTDTARCS